MDTNAVPEAREARAHTYIYLHNAYPVIIMNLFQCSFVEPGGCRSSHLMNRTDASMCIPVFVSVVQVLDLHQDTLPMDVADAACEDS